MMGNYQVRFLGELQLVTVAAYPAVVTVVKAMNSITVFV